ncbi:MAG: ComEC/Rec2 family competence protein [Chloroflexota bacterium]
MTIIYLCIAWLAGIGIGRDAPVSWWIWLALGLPALAGVALAPRTDDEDAWTGFSWRTAFGCALLFALGAARMALAIPHFGAGDLASYNDQGFVTINGWLADAPDVRDTHVNLRLRAESITLDDGETRPVKGLALVQAPRVESYRYGDPVSVRGQIGAPPESDEFSYRDYLARQGVYSLVQYADVTVIGERRGNPIRALALDFRTTAYQTIQRLLPDPQASLLAGILLGIESGISPAVRDAFNAVSATHVIAISGSNLVILAGVIQGITKRFAQKRLSAGLTIGGVLGYALFVGGDPAVMRAALMVTLALVSTQLGRQAWGFASLAFAGLLMTAINPQTLWDVGFQLSFLSTLGLLIYVAPLQRGLERGLSTMLSAESARQVVLAVSDAFLVTIAAQITTAPIMAHTFGRFSVVALPVSFLIVPLQTPLMILGGLGVLAALVVWPVGQVLAWGSWLFLTLTIWIVRRFARLPFASLDVSLSAAAMVGVYAGLFALTWLLSQDSEARSRWRDRLRSLGGVRLIAGAGLVIALLLMIGAGSLPNGRLHVTFVDVGDGSATLVETPSGRTILVDAGGSSRQLQTALGDSLPFWQRRLDLVILSQPDQAHTSALSPLLARYQVDAALVGRRCARRGCRSPAHSRGRRWWWAMGSR